MNFVAGKVADNQLLLDAADPAPLGRHLGNLAAGQYRFGIRPSHLNMHRSSAAEIEFQRTIDLAEISGSETYVHLEHQGNIWTVQQSGIHKYRLGEQAQVYVDPTRLYVFDLDGRLLASPENGSQGSAEGAQ